MHVWRSLRQFTWFAQHCAQYESDWMALHRFLWMNAMTGEDLWRELSGRSIRSAVPLSKDVPLRFETYICESSLTQDFSAHMRARSLLECFGAGNAWEIEQTEYIRHCPLCLRECFHSPLFQLANVQDCPFHGVPLLRSCEHCGTPFTGSLTLSPDDFNFPLCCRSCKRAFLGDDTHKVFAGFPHAATTFRRQERWLKHLRQVQFGGLSTLGGEPWKPRDYPLICDLMVLLGKQSAAHTPWHTLPRSRFCVYRAPATAPSQPSDFAKTRLALPLNDDFEAATAIAKSINRMLTRLVRGLCGHRRTMELNWGRADRPFEHLQPLILMSPKDCPCCAVLDRWRAYAGKVIAMRNVARRMMMFGPIYDEFADAGYRKYLCLEPEAFAIALLSSFTWFAVGLDKLLQALEPEEFDDWYSAGSLRELRKTSAMPMDLHRFAIKRHGYYFAGANETLFVAYSLPFARESLERCLARLRQGLMWPTPQPMRFAEFFTRNHDAWYIRMSEHLNSGRRGQRMWVNHPPLSLENLA